MRNHNEKTRDMARSVLPSTARRGARKDRAAVRSRERARERAELHALGSYADPDDYEGEDEWIARRDIAEMVYDRRAADKVGPLIQWATRTVEADPTLAAAIPEERVEHFRNLMPAGVIGDHAITHLERALGYYRYWSPPYVRRASAPEPSLRDMVEAIVAAGRHGDLNRRIRGEIKGVVEVRTFHPASRVIDACHPAPGRLVPAHTTTEYRRRAIRFLAGAHDIDAFVKDLSRGSYGEGRVVRAIYDEITHPKDRP